MVALRARTRLATLLALTPLPILAACDSGESGDAKDEAAPATAAEAAPAPSGTTETPAPETAPEPKRPEGSFEYTVTGDALNGTWKGTSALLYDMVGVTHLSLNTEAVDMIADFSIDGSVRPEVGVIPLAKSNLDGWIFTLSEGMRDDDGWNSDEGELEITKVEDGRYEGRFRVEATRQLSKKDPIKLEGTFVAYEKKRKKKD